MNIPNKKCSAQIRYASKQGGVVLFIALIALVTLMLAAVSLLRSTDTAAVIAGNLAYKQAAATSADFGVAKAAAWIKNVDDANKTTDAFANTAHPFNNDNVAAGYYSSALTPNLDLKADSTWQAVAAGVSDSSGNAVQYIIQRMCRSQNAKISEADCLFSDAQDDNNSKVRVGPEIGGKHVLNRVTIRVAGPRNTLSYVQAFIY